MEEFSTNEAFPFEVMTGKSTHARGSEWHIAMSFDLLAHLSPLARPSVLSPSSPSALHSSQKGNANDTNLGIVCIIRLCYAEGGLKPSRQAGAQALTGGRTHVWAGERT
eukprot:3383094-Pyramimonas_sp.AAC.1